MLSWIAHTKMMREHLSQFETSMVSYTPDADTACSPPLLARNPPATRNLVSQTLHASEDFLASLLTIICDLQSEAETLRVEVASHHARFVNARTPAMALPAEILREIFSLVNNQADQYGVQESDEPINQLEERSSPAVVLSHVCRLWRDTAVAQRDLWYRIVLPIPSTHLQLYTERSRQGPIDLIIRDHPSVKCLKTKRGFITGGASSRMEKLVSVSLFQSRIRKINMAARCGVTRRCDRLLDILHLHENPVLNSLESLCLWSRNAENCIVELDGFKLPSLRSVRLFSVGLWGIDSLPTVTRLECRLSREQHSHPRTLEDLADYPNLETLRLAGGVKDHRYFVIYKHLDRVVRLPHLRHLELSSAPVGELAEFVSFLHAPGVQTLVLSYKEGENGVNQWLDDVNCHHLEDMLVKEVRTTGIMPRHP